MLNQLARVLIDPAGLTPHGFCLLWQPGIIWLHGASDVAIGLAYFSIPVALALIVKRRRDLMFKPVLLLFAAFIVLCGIGHLISLLTIWVPAYGLEGVVKAATAITSILTAGALWLLIPRVLLLPSPAQLRQVTEALSHREQQALELARLNADLEQFAYIASHDLKAPLHAIARLADWVHHDVRDIAGPETIENLRLMRQRADRLEMLIESLLRYARVGHGKAPVEPVDLRNLVREITNGIELPAGFAVGFEGQVPTVVTQRLLLEHVFRNLILNAIKHHDRPAGTVVVSAKVTDGVLECRVEDDGPGIAPEFHRRIFTIFQTLQSRDDTESSGIGLSIVQKSVERAGGRVWVESEPPRRGSVFVFTWPESLPSDPAASEHEPGMTTRAPRRRTSRPATTKPKSDVLRRNDR